MAIDYDHPRLKNAEPKAISLLKGLLEQDRFLRLSCTDALNHSFLRNCNINKIIKSNTSVDQNLSKKTSFYSNILKKSQSMSDKQDKEDSADFGGDEDEPCNLKHNEFDDAGIFSTKMMARSNFSGTNTFRSQISRSIKSVMAFNSPFANSVKVKVENSNEVTRNMEGVRFLSKYMSV